MTENLNKMSPGALDIIEQATEHLEFLYATGLTGDKYQDTEEMLEGLALVELDNETYVAVLDQLNNGEGSVGRGGGSRREPVLPPSCSTVFPIPSSFPILTKEDCPSIPPTKTLPRME